MGSYNPAEPWTNPAYEDSKFVKWNAPGDVCIGVLRDWSEGQFEAEEAKDGKAAKEARAYPIMHLDTANGEKLLGLTLMDLKAQVFAAKPKIGDTVTARYLRDGKPKMFHVEVTRAVAPADPMEGVRIDTAPVGYRPKSDYVQPVQDEAPF